MANTLLTREQFSKELQESFLAFFATYLKRRRAAKKGWRRRRKNTRAGDRKC
jgi:hypothetical protein